MFVSFSMVSIISVSQFAQARELVVTEQFEGSIPYVNGIPLSGSLLVGETISVGPASIIDNDFDQVSDIDKNNLHPVSWFLVDKEITDYLITAEQYANYVTDGKIIEINEGKPTTTVELKPEAAGKKLGYRITPKSETGFPSIGKELIITNVIYAGKQTPQGENIDSENKKERSGIVDKIKDDGIIDYNEETIKVVITRLKNTKFNTPETVVYDERDGGLTNLVVPRAEDQFKVELFGPENINLTENYKETIRWSLRTDVGDDLYAIDDKLVTEETSIIHMFDYNEQNPTVIAMQSYNNYPKSSFKHPIHKSHQSTKLVLKFGFEDASTASATEATSVTATPVINQ